WLACKFDLGNSSPGALPGESRSHGPAGQDAGERAREEERRRPSWRTCVYQKLNSAIVVMKATPQTLAFDASDPLNWAREGRVLVQRTVRSHFIVKSGIGF